MNSFGARFRFTTFGESHGAGIGCVLDGVPAGLKIDEAFMQSELDRRRPGGNAYGTKRNEADKAEILSGVFEGVSTGAPIAVLIRNETQKSADYDDLREIFRPSHADYSWFMKYGLRDHRGGGRSSARESAARVAAGAIAKLLLAEIGVSAQSGVFAIGGVFAREVDYVYAKTSQIFALDRQMEKAQIEAVEKAREAQDSVGGVVKITVFNAPAGLGEPLYEKLDAKLAEAIMGINAAKAVEIGEGANAANLLGSQNNDQITPNGFLSNRAGGILGGVSTGEPIEITAHFKPTPSIYQPQQTIDVRREAALCAIKGRHDPCVAIRGSVVCEAMVAIAIADMVLLNLASKIENIKTLYGAKR
jgi:chorismate synthase